jgi:hypothetical protein
MTEKSEPPKTDKQKKKRKKFLPPPDLLMEKIIEAEMDRDPFVIGLMKNYAAFGGSDIALQIWQRIEPKLTEKALRKDYFAPNPHGQEVDGDIRVGSVKHTKAPFGLNLEELGEHTLITGRAGAGKTTLIYILLEQLLKQKIPFWAFDFKQDYRHLIKLGNVLVFDLENFRFNPLRPPLGVKPKVWMQAFTTVFSQSYVLYEGTQSIILPHIYNLYNDYGVFSGSDTYPTMFDLYESLKRHKLGKKPIRESQWLESATYRINKCLLSFGDMLDCDKGFPIENLLLNNVVFEIEDFENQPFILTIILRYVFQYRISNNQRSPLKHVFLFDEAKSVYNKEQEKKDTGIPEISKFTTKIREFGEGLVVADQLPTKLGDSIKANVYTVICMSQSGGNNIKEMSNALGLNREQSEVCRTLNSDKTTKIFEAIVKLNGKWLTPFVIHVTPFEMEKDVNTAQLQDFMNPALEKLSKKVTPRKNYEDILKAKEREWQLRDLEEKKARREKAEEREKIEGHKLITILSNIREEPFISQKERIERLQLGSSSSTTNKYFDTLIAKGFVTKHKLSFGKGYGGITLYEITEKGRKFALMDNIEIPGKGDMPHKFWQHTIKDFYERLYKDDDRLSGRVEIEKRYPGKNVDVGFELDGKKVAVEIQHTLEHLTENIQLDLQGGCDQVIIAVPTKRKANSYRKKLEDIYTEDVLEKIEFRVLTDFLPQKDAE